MKKLHNAIVFQLRLSLFKWLSNFADLQSPCKVQFLYKELDQCITNGDINRLKQMALHNIHLFKRGQFDDFVRQVDHRLSVINFAKRFHGFVFTSVELADMFRVASTIAECDGLLLNIKCNRKAYKEFGRGDLSIYDRMASKRISELLCENQSKIKVCTK